MRKQKASHSSEFKSRVALEAIRGDLTLNEIASKYKIHTTQIYRWKQQAIASIKSCFTGKQEKLDKNQEQLTEDLYKEIGRQKVELEWLKKSMGLTLMEKKQKIDAVNTLLSVREQCNLLGLNRASFYYQPKPMDAYNLELMQIIDVQYTKTPFYGVPRMTAYLRQLGYIVNHKRIERLMGLMGISAIYPKPKLSVVAIEHKIYPYLLRNLLINRPNQVWCTDITFIKLLGGFIYLVAIMDWFSRFVLSWNISNTLTADFCVQALKDALMLYGKPDIFNSDQGSQFTSEEFTSTLLDFNIKISMDGRGRYWDNIFIERLWRSVKYEEVFLNDYPSVTYAKERLTNYFNFYDYERLHQALGYKTPYAVYRGRSH